MSGFNPCRVEDGYIREFGCIWANLALGDMQGADPEGNYFLSFFSLKGSLDHTPSMILFRPTQPNCLEKIRKP